MQPDRHQLTNSSPDIYTEGLKASVNTVPAGSQRWRALAT
jgi:hypothetical protein